MTAKMITELRNVTSRSEIAAMAAAATAEMISGLNT